MATQFGFYNYDRMKRLEIFGLIHFITVKFDLNDTNDSYIRFFQDMVLEFIKQRKGGLPEFLEWWEEKSKKASVIIPEGIEAIRVMTIHKAKGLQFPVVIYPFADEQVRATRKHIWVPLQEELAEPLKTAYLPVTTALAETPYNDLYLDELDRSTVDMVNLMYVALTRPEERLYILTDEISDKSDGTKTIGKFLGNFLSHAGYFDNGKDVYEFGAGWEKTGSKLYSMEQKENDADFLSRSALQMSLRYHAPLAWDMDDPEKNREWGTLVHTVMARIKHAIDVEPVLQDMLLQGDISSARYDEMKEMMEKLLKHEKIAGFFDPDAEIRNEPEIMSADGSLFRPDRLLLGPAGVIVIDYKTGRRAEAHHQQVKTYARLIGEMNYKVDQAYLLYLNKEPEVVRVI
jgi:ATP-dependent exoDNAse (exonuclease V) beta subunit